MPTIQDYQNEYKSIQVNIIDLKEDLNRVSTDAGRKAIQEALRKAENRLSDLKYRKFIIGTSSPHENQVFEVLDERNGMYIIWESPQHPEDDFNYIETEGAEVIKLPFQID
ncbi:MAG: hypothetical protein ACQEXV_22600 [Bacillota bacterium]